MEQYMSSGKYFTSQYEFVKASFEVPEDGRIHRNMWHC
jgi:hypothetical protein